MVDPGQQEVVRLIAASDVGAFRALLSATPDLVRARVRPAQARFAEEIAHQVYEGDTALHLVAAAYRTSMARLLLAKGADASARNRLGAEPLHYAADGAPGSPRWNPRAQAATIRCLVAAGADVDAKNDLGVAPLHRAVRTRCSAAVEALLDCGADVRLKNKGGSTPRMLAVRTTGSGGAGGPEARAEQAKIVRMLDDAGA